MTKPREFGGAFAFFVDWRVVEFFACYAAIAPWLRWVTRCGFTFLPIELFSIRRT